ncbi:MAG: DUF2382 domain-containing protein [Chloroflexi bacterium]|nr:DUF2382 domain-containing protein [Chloroflexota bacterium]
MNDYDGADVVDADGNKIGKIVRSFADDAGVVRFVQVKTGTLFAKHHLIPTDDAQEADGAVQVPYSKDVVEASPQADPGDTLEGNLLSNVRSYYAESAPATAEADSTAEEGEEPAAATPVAAAEPEDHSPRQPAITNAADGDTAVSSADQVRDAGNYIEIPIIEERLVKQPVVKEVLRVRKTQVAEQQTVRTDLRREDVEVVPDSDVPVRDNE